MTRLKPGKTKGQSLLEVVIALSVALIVILALVRVTIVAMRNAQFAKNQALATQSAQEAMETVRAYRDQNSWETFVNNCEFSGGSGLPSLLTLAVDCYLPPPLTGECSPSDESCEVKVTVSWTDSQGSHQSELTTRLTKWE
jgi:type II secretory pathway pseudopilin PulG